MAHLDLRPANVFIKQNPDRSESQSQCSISATTDKGQAQGSGSGKTVSDLLVAETYVLKLGDLGHAVCQRKQIGSRERAGEGCPDYTGP